MKCCVCKKEIIGFGNDPWPLCNYYDKKSRCCNDCNNLVITARYDMARNNKSIGQVQKEYLGKECKMLVFDKEKVLASIKEAGNEDKITPEIIEELDNYDGCKAIISDWDLFVKGEELYFVKGKNGTTVKIEKRFTKECD